MKKIINSPSLWLALLAVLLGVYLHQAGTLRDLRTTDDSPGYLEMRFDSLLGVLSYYRTAGYPAFLRAVAHFDPSLETLPYWHYGLSVLAALAFYMGLRELRVPGWAAMAAAASVLYSNSTRRFLPMLMAESVSLSLAVTAVGSLLTVIARPRSCLPWVGLTVALFLTYQTRPAFLFLLPLAPVLGLLLAWLVWTRDEWRRRRRWVGAGLAGVGLVPFLAYCGLRLALVGHFGVVSFEGYNIVGIAAQFLTDDIVPQLPEDVRPLAYAVLEKQKQVADKGGPGYEAFLAFPYRPREWEPSVKDGWVNYSVMRGKYDALTWALVIPTAEDHYGDDNVLINQKLSRLSKAVLLARPVLYTKWLRKALEAGLFELIGQLQGRLVYGLVLVAALAHLALVVESRRTSPEPLRRPPFSAETDYVHAMNVTLSIAVGFALAKLTLVVLAGPPSGRYLSLAAVFLTAPLAVWACDRLHRLVARPTLPAGLAD